MQWIPTHVPDSAFVRASRRNWLLLKSLRYAKMIGMLDGIMADTDFSSIIEHSEKSLSYVPEDGRHIGVALRNLLPRESTFHWCNVHCIGIDGTLRHRCTCLLIHGWGLRWRRCRRYVCRSSYRVINTSWLFIFQHDEVAYSKTNKVWPGWDWLLSRYLMTER